MTALFPTEAPSTSPKVLRDDQAEAVERIRDAIRSGKRRIMVQAPCGYGKTIVGASIVDAARAKGNRVLFTVPALSLVDQTVAGFEAQGIHDVGVIQANHERTNWDMPVQVASVQTLMKRNIPEAKVVLVDEAHRWFNFYGKWFHDPSWKDIPIIGLSATPWTKGLGAYYDELIIAGTTAEMIERGVLSPFKVFAPSHPDLKGVRTLAGDYHEGDLSTVMNKAPLVADVVSTWLARANGLPTLCFGVDRAHADHLRQQFVAAGVPTDYMDANTSMDERESIKRAFHNGDVQVVCNVGVLTTGVDWDVRCLILARPTKSEMLFVQIIGRALRTAEGKDAAIILDHSDTHLRLGFVTDIHHSELNDGRERVKSERNMPLPKECPQCAYLKPPRTAVCPNCGFKAQIVSHVEHANGELAELKPRGNKLGEKPAGERFPDRHSTYAQLRQYAFMHSYKEGWASNKYRDLYGVWPRGMDDHREPVAADLASWIKHTQIKWAKGRQRASGTTQVERDAAYISGVREMAMPAAQAVTPVTFMTERDWDEFR